MTCDIQVGDRVDSVNFGWMQVVSDPYPSGTNRKEPKIDVKFENTGCLRGNVLVSQFLLGAVRDGSIIVNPQVGDVFKSNEYGYAEIIEYHHSKDFVLQFQNTGNIQDNNQLDSMLLGMFTDRKLKQDNLIKSKDADEQRKVQLAQEREIKKEYLEKVLAELRLERDKRRLNTQKRREEEQRRSEVFQAAKLRKEQEYERNLEDALKISNVETNLWKPSKGVLDVDFKDRDGNWVLRYKYDNNFIQTRLGKLHNNMTQRANIGGSYQNKNNSYIGTSASDDFKDAHKFCEWATQQEGWGLGWSLDKDLLGGNSSIYSADTCTFLPQKINSAIIKTTRDKKTFISISKGKYHLKFYLGTKRIVINNLENEEIALNLYKKYREGYVRKLAEEYRNFLSEKAYKALISWEL